MKRTLFAAILAAAAGLVPAIAAADTIDLSAGYLGTRGGDSAGTGIVTFQGPRFGPFGAQVSGMFPFAGGGTHFAATAEGVFHAPGGAYLGAGLGVGRLSLPLQTGMLYDVVGGVPVFPHLDVVARYYSGTSRAAGQGIFGGLELRL
ncbi:MAG TPA: hypothetical protein VE591_14390 [Candidatus Acidoferrum sp.]|nr:hypothetical protein [Candidatus Acidoferrum sp.]